MTELDLTVLLASIVAGAAPIVLAVLGETISEKGGVINLSLDGSILLSAMVAFAIAYQSHNLVLGFAGGALVGAMTAAVVGFFSVFLGQSQVAVGFVLTLTAKDLAYFLGNPYARLYGPQAGVTPIPWLQDVPVLGPIFFHQSVPAYLSLLLIPFAWWYLYKTPMGLRLRAIGEHPEAAYARGTNTRAIQFWYTVVGGLLVGLAGATFSLCTKTGWGRPQGAEGTGWIALAIVIFGGWHPVKTALGAYLFAFLQIMGIYFQGWWPSVPAQVFQVAPFPFMVFTLIVMYLAQKNSSRTSSRGSPWLRGMVRILSGSAPAGLGRSFKPD
jgi:general nucleoside transport system permease protein